jgi:hypothetical protein
MFEAGVIGLPMSGDNIEFVTLLFLLSRWELGPFPEERLA